MPAAPQRMSPASREPKDDSTGDGSYREFLFSIAGLLQHVEWSPGMITGNSPAKLHVENITVSVSMADAPSRYRNAFGEIEIHRWILSNPDVHGSA
jgi:hypothetical protein